VEVGDRGFELDQPARLQGAAAQALVDPPARRDVLLVHLGEEVEEPFGLASSWSGWARTCHVTSWRSTLRTVSSSQNAKRDWVPPRRNGKAAQTVRSFASSSPWGTLHSSGVPMISASVSTVMNAHGPSASTTLVLRAGCHGSTVVRWAPMWW
jgi:hypothetical protein